MNLFLYWNPNIRSVCDVKLTSRLNIDIKCHLLICCWVRRISFRNVCSELNAETFNFLLSLRHTMHQLIFVPNILHSIISIYISQKSCDDEEYMIHTKNFLMNQRQNIKHKYAQTTSSSCIFERCPNQFLMFSVSQSQGEELHVSKNQHQSQFWCNWVMWTIFLERIWCGMKMCVWCPVGVAIAMCRTKIMCSSTEKLWCRRNSEQ